MKNAGEKPEGETGNSGNRANKMINGDHKQVRLNGIELTFDADSGCLSKMSLTETGEVLSASAQRQSILDVATPIPELEFLRRRSACSRLSVFEKQEDRVVLGWDELAPTRKVDLGGPVKARITIRASSDGKSLIFQCCLENHSFHPIRQVLFPDLSGLLPFAGEKETELRTAGFVERIFENLKSTTNNGYHYPAQPNHATWHSGGYFQQFAMFARWLDLGSRNGGFSLFPRLWGFGQADREKLANIGHSLYDTVHAHRSQIDGSLRLMCSYRGSIDPGQKWQSPEYVLTPHQHGWAEGIKSYIEWICSNQKRRHSLPRRIRDGLGYRTIWMMDQYEKDPEQRGLCWRFEDLPEVARDAAAHGLNEIVLWNAVPFFILPFKGFYSQLGTEEDFKKAVEKCRKLGVTVTFFVSWFSLAAASASRYGWKVQPENAWTYHLEMTPRFNPYYATGAQCAFVDQTHEQWQKDVIGSAERLIQMGSASLSWDQFGGCADEPNLYQLAERIRDMARRVDPESSFSGESFNNIDSDSEILDYTWNWNMLTGQTDYRALVAAYPGTRWNMNVGGADVADVKRIFFDNLFVNALPSKPEGISGSSLISDYPQLSKELKHCARLRKQFLEYFTRGRLIGDCILRESPEPGRVNAWILEEERALVMIMNRDDKKCSLNLRFCLSPWIESASGRYQVIFYDEEGTESDRKTAGNEWNYTTPALSPDEMLFMELLVQE